MKKHNKHKKGFTLMEVLVATSIFAVVMVIATGILAQGSTYGGKIKKLRETSEDARRMSDMLTRDIKSVKNPVKIKYVFDSVNDNDCMKNGIISGTFNSGILILNSSGSGFCLIYSHPESALDTTKLYNASALVLAGKDNYMIYVNGPDERVHYSNTIPVTTELTFFDINSVRTNSNIISNQGYYSYIGFGGFSSPVDYVTGDPLVQKMQSIVNFCVTVWDKNYDLSSKKGEKAVIRSSVSSRNYGI